MYDVLLLIRFERENENKLENYLKAEFSSYMASLWFHFRLKIIGITMLFSISLIAVFIHQWNLTNAGLYLLKYLPDRYIKKKRKKYVVYIIILL